jgi:phospholipid/cholesterol/gamma-HCH transport system substrate-binding protein
MSLELSVGLFLIAGFLCFVYLAMKLGDVNLFESNVYEVKARFGTVTGLKAGADVEMAGVKVGRVADIKLGNDGIEAVVSMQINNGVKLESDSIASIRTAGIIGDRYVNITRGGADEFINGGGEIVETESAVVLEELISKYIFEK